MAKLPSYLKVEWKPGLKGVVIIKRWGLPIIIFKTLKKYYNLKWYQWFIYPWICIKLIRDGFNG